MESLDRPAAMALWITTGLIGLFAAGLLINPAELQTGHGAGQPPAGAYATELRASSGGFKLGVAVAMGVLAWRRRYREGLVLAVAVLAGGGGARLLGCLAGDATTLHWLVAAAEVFGAGSCGWHLWRLGGFGRSDSKRTC